LCNDSDIDDHDDNDDDGNNNNTPAELFRKPKQICAFHADLARATQHGGSSWSARSNTLNHTQSALSPSAFYVTGNSFKKICTVQTGTGAV